MAIEFRIDVGEAFIPLVWDRLRPALKRPNIINEGELPPLEAVCQGPSRELKQYPHEGLVITYEIGSNDELGTCIVLLDPWSPKCQIKLDYGKIKEASVPWSLSIGGWIVDTRDRAYDLFSRLLDELGDTADTVFSWLLMIQYEPIYQSREAINPQEVARHLRKWLALRPKA